MNKNNFNRICLVHYHEIGLKGKNRSFFENKLKRNISKVMKFNNLDFSQILKISGRICIVFDESKSKDDANFAISIIKKIPGAARVSTGFKVGQNLEAMTSGGILVMDEAGANDGKVESFKVSARRNHTSFKHDSMEINQIVGGNISDAFPHVKVQMKDPDINVRVEVIEGSAYVYGVSIKGVGGLPVGSAGRIIGLMSSGIDSPVAL